MPDNTSQCGGADRCPGRTKGKLAHHYAALAPIMLLRFQFGLALDQRQAGQRRTGLRIAAGRGIGVGGAGCHTLAAGRRRRASNHGTKHAVIGMTKSAGVEYAPRGIRINAVCPGTIDTPMVREMLDDLPNAMAEILKQQPIGRLGRADEVAAAVLWLCSSAASFVVGVVLPVEGGFTAHWNPVLSRRVTGSRGPTIEIDVRSRFLAEVRHAKRLGSCAP